MTKTLQAAAIVVMLLPMTAHAHVSITPRQSTTNTVIMSAGFMLVGHQLTGYFQQ